MTKNKIIGYKVVRVLPDGRLASAVAEGKAMVHYKPGKLVRTHRWLGKYGLFFFKNIYDAKIFFRIEKFEKNFFMIWQVECEDVKKGRLPGMLDMWKLERGIKKPARWPYPTGTKMARGIKLIQEVPRVEYKY